MEFRDLEFFFMKIQVLGCLISQDYSSIDQRSEKDFSIEALDLYIY